MTQIYIEHVNLTVSDQARTMEMLAALFGWSERWQGTLPSGGRTVHFGSDQFYLALFTPELGLPDGARHKKGLPMNHIGIVVDDVDEIERRAIAFGLETFAHGDYEPGRRFYFFDHDGIEFEIISYASAPFIRQPKASEFSTRFADISRSLMTMSGFRQLATS